MSEKICRTCHNNLQLSEFHKDKASKDGHRNVCKKCKANFDKEFQTKHRDRYLEQRKSYRISHIDEERRKGRAWSKTNYSLNKSEVLEDMKDYYLKNKDRKQKYNKEYADKNRDVIREKGREYYINNRHIRYAGNARRRASKLTATPIWANLDKIKEVYKLREKISKETGILHHVDHVIPLGGKTVCGLHVEYNLQVIPARDNLSKHIKFVDE